MNRDKVAMEQECRGRADTFSSEAMNPFGEGYAVLNNELEVRHSPYEILETEWVKEVHVIVSPPVRTNLFLRFLTATRESLHLSTRRIAGSYETGYSLTMYLQNPILLTALLTKLREICKIEAIGYLASAQEQYPDIVKKLVATEGLEDSQIRIIFVKLSKN